MYKETIRVNGVEVGTRHVIKSLQSIPDVKGFFSDLHKVNKTLNKNNVKISFAGTDQAMLNGQVGVLPSELRTNLRQVSVGGDNVFSNVPSIPETNLTVAAGNLQTPMHSEDGGLLRNTLPSPVRQIMQSPMFIKFTMEQSLKVINFIWRFYNENEELIRERCEIRFDSNFVSDVLSCITFLAEKLGKTVYEYLEYYGLSALNEKMLTIYNNQLVAKCLNAVDVTERRVFHYEEMLEILTHIRDKIKDEHSFKELILRLMEDLTIKVIEKLIIIANISFCSMLDFIVAVAERYITFEDYFQNVITIVLQLAAQSGFRDISFYILLLDNIDLETIHSNVSLFYNHFRDKKETTAKCKICPGAFSIIQ